MRPDAGAGKRTQNDGIGCEVKGGSPESLGSFGSIQRALETELYTVCIFVSSS